MVKRRSILCFGVGVLIFSLEALGSSVASLDRSKIIVGESAYLRVELEGSLTQDPAFPDIKHLDWKIVGQSSKSTRSLGGTQSSTILEIQITPEKKGTFKVPYMEFEVDDEVVKVDGFTLEVEGTRTLTDEEIAREKPNFFIKQELHPLVVYINQPIRETLKIYLKHPWKNLTKVGKDHPFIKGFDVGKATHNQEVVHGTTYSVVTIKRILVPLKTGDMEFESRGIQVDYVEPSLRRGSIFGGLFGASAMRSYMVKAPSRVIGVNGLPGVVPDDFSGFVGEMELFAEVSPRKVRIGESLVVRLDFQGLGWTGNLQAASLEFPSSFKVYPESPQSEQSAEVRGLVGKKSFSYVLMPLTEGVVDLGRYTWSYFDTMTKSYKRLVVRLGEVEVRGKGEFESSEVDSAPGGEGARATLQVLGEDIRDLRRVVRGYELGDDVERKAGVFSSLRTSMAFPWFLLVGLWCSLIGWGLWSWLQRIRQRRKQGLQQLGSQRYRSEFQKRVRLLAQQRDLVALKQLFSDHTRRVYGVESSAVTVFDMKRALATFSLTEDQKKLLAQVWEVFEGMGYGQKTAGTHSLPDDFWLSLQEVVLGPESSLPSTSYVFSSDMRG